MQAGHAPEPSTASTSQQEDSHHGDTSDIARGRVADLVDRPGSTGRSARRRGCPLLDPDPERPLRVLGEWRRRPRAQPKAIVEVIRFDGDGTLTVPAATRSVNGVVAQSPPGGTGIYSVADLVPADGACAGHLTFTNGPSFDLFIRANGEKIWMIQTDSGNVFQGAARNVSR
jgi:hypothetical protein